MKTAGNVKGDGDRANVGHCLDEIVFIKGGDFVEPADLGADVILPYLFLGPTIFILGGTFVGILCYNAADVVNILHGSTGPSASASIVAKMTTSSGSSWH